MIGTTPARHAASENTIFPDCSKTARMSVFDAKRAESIPRVRGDHRAPEINSAHSRNDDAASEFCFFFKLLVVAVRRRSNRTTEKNSLSMQIEFPSVCFGLPSRNVTGNRRRLAFPPRQHIFCNSDLFFFSFKRWTGEFSSRATGAGAGASCIIRKSFDYASDRTRRLCTRKEILIVGGRRPTCIQIQARTPRNSRKRRDFVTLERKSTRTNKERRERFLTVLFG